MNPYEEKETVCERCGAKCKVWKESKTHLCRDCKLDNMIWLIDPRLKPPAVMKQFEYKYFTNTILGVTDWLNTLGTQGWQCVYLDLTTTVGHVYGYFMRELKQQEK